MQERSYSERKFALRMLSPSSGKSGHRRHRVAQPEEQLQDVNYIPAMMFHPSSGKSSYLPLDMEYLRTFPSECNVCHKHPGTQVCNECRVAVELTVNLCSSKCAATHYAMCLAGSGENASRLQTTQATRTNPTETPGQSTGCAPTSPNRWDSRTMYDIRSAVAPLGPKLEGYEPATAWSLRLDLQKRWIEHFLWTRAFIVSNGSEIGDLEFVAARLQRNQYDLGRIITAWYGEPKGKMLENLLHEHITIAARIVDTMRLYFRGPEGIESRAPPTKGNEPWKEDAALWTENARQIAIALSQLNEQTGYLPFDTVFALMLEHLKVTSEEAILFMERKYKQYVQQGDVVEDCLLKISNAIATAIINDKILPFSSKSAAEALSALTPKSTGTKRGPSDGMSSAVESRLDAEIFDRFRLDLQTKLLDHGAWTARFIFRDKFQLADEDAALLQLQKNSDAIAAIICQYHFLKDYRERLAGLLREHVNRMGIIVIMLRQAGSNVGLRREHVDVAGRIINMLRLGGSKEIDKMVRDIYGEDPAPWVFQYQGWTANAMKIVELLKVMIPPLDDKALAALMAEHLQGDFDLALLYMQDNFKAATIKTSDVEDCLIRIAQTLASAVIQYQMTPGE